MIIVRTLRYVHKKVERLDSPENMIPNPVEVRETCDIAVNLIKWKLAGRQGEAPLHCACMSPYSSVDPAPPTATDDLSTAELEKLLRDTAQPLFERYRAMFSLRNRAATGETNIYYQ